MRVLQAELTWWQGSLARDLLLGITSDGRFEPVQALRPDDALQRLPGQLLLPGLVNAHSHAFQRVLRGRTEYAATGPGQDDFWSWRELMYRAAERLEPDALHAVSRQAFVEMARAGITSVGEFHYVHHDPQGVPYADRLELSRAVIEAAREVGLRIHLLRVAYARSGFEVPQNPRQKRFIDPRPEDVLADVTALQKAYAGDPLVQVGLAPHSVRAVPREWLSTFVGAQDSLPALHMHVSEQPAEIEACLRESGKRPVELLADLGLLSPRFTAVHGIHLSETEVRLLGEAKANVCACPTTEANLGDGVIPADHLLAAGAEVSLGSDSQARIDLLEEARRLEEHLRLVRQQRAVLDAGGGAVDGLAKRLLHAATVAGSRALGQEASGPGAPADCFTVDLRHPSIRGFNEESLLPTVIFGAPREAVREVYVAGRRIVEDGAHPLEAPTADAFDDAVRRLFI